MSSYISQQDVGLDQQVEEHLEHDGQHKRGKQDLELLPAELLAELRPDLGTDRRADQQQQGEHEIDGMILG